MKIPRLPALALTTALVAFSAAVIHPVLAQENAPVANELTLTAIPPRLGEDGTLKIKPGEKSQFSVRVRNASRQTITVDSSVEDYILDEDGKTPIPIRDEVSNRWSMAKWIVLAPSSQVLAPNQIGLVTVVVDAPADALPGGHYAMIVHRPSLGGALAGTDEKPSASAINQRVGTLLYAMVAGPINEEAFLRSFTMPTLTEYGPVPFSVTVENLSDIHIRPQITLEIKNMFGRSVDRFSLETLNVFPLMSRAYSGNWNRVWGIGYYTATMTMSYGTGGQLAVSSTSFWLLPYTLIIVGILVFLALCGILLYIRRRLALKGQAEAARIKELESELDALHQAQNHQ
jgi:hypothetical protein